MIRREQRIDRLGGYARPAIGHFDPHRAVVPGLHDDGNRFSLGRELDCILQQVEQRLPEHFTVCTDRHPAVGQYAAERQLLGVQVGLQQGCQFVDDLRDGNLGRFRLTRPRECKKLIDPGGDPIAFLDDRLGLLSLLGIIA